MKKLSRFSAFLLAIVVLACLLTVPVLAAEDNDFTAYIASVSDSGDGKVITVAYSNNTGGEVSLGWVGTCELRVTTDEGVFSRKATIQEEFMRFVKGDGQYSFIISPCSGTVQSLELTDLRVLNDRNLPEYELGSLLLKYDAPEAPSTTETPSTPETPDTSEDPAAPEIPSTSETPDAPEEEPDRPEARPDESPADKGHSSAGTGEPASPSGSSSSNPFSGWFDFVTGWAKIQLVIGVVVSIAIAIAIVLFLIKALPYIKWRFKKAKKRMWADEHSEEAAREAGKRGEADVNYHLTWFVREHPEYRVIAHDCISKRNEPCLRLANPPQYPEPQEIDHLLVGPAGVLHIETKNWSGIIDVEDTETWYRTKKNGSSEKCKSPAYQVRRHELILKSIVAERLPVYSIICIADEKTEIRNRERSKFLIVQIQHLDNALSEFASHGDSRFAAAVDSVVHDIERCKVRDSQPDCYLSL